MSELEIQTRARPKAQPQPTEQTLAMRRTLETLSRVVLYVLLTFASVLMTFPLFWMMSTSLKTVEEANAPRIIWIPEQVVWDAYETVLTDPEFLQAYFNSAFYAAFALT